MEMKTYRVVLTYEDGSMDVAMVAVADEASVMMLSRGWLLTAADAVSVRCYGVGWDGRCAGVASEYVR